MNQLPARRTTFLIADDNEQMRQILRRFCPAAAADVIECCNGEEAVEAYSQRRPDWVLMDLRMPRLDGLGATARILAAFPKAKIVIVTELQSAEAREAARQAGAAGFVLKDNLHTLQQTFANIVL